MQTSNDERDVDEIKSNLVATVKKVPRSSSLYFVGCFINNFYKVELTCEGLVKFSDCLIDEETIDFTEKFLGDFLLSDVSQKMSMFMQLIFRFRILVLTEAKEALIFDSHIHRDHIHRGPRRSAGQTQDIREVNEETPYHISCLPYFKELNNNAEG